MSQAMYLLDTNVLSELMREQPAPEVLRWFAAHAAGDMATSSVTQAEILTGIALMPEGRRKKVLAQAAAQMFEQDFSNPCLSFDSEAAERYALVVANRQRLGQPMSVEDAQIAAIALVAGLVVVTRNTKDFENIEGLELNNPWL
jgi:predicted nucleic acid-binding protein